MRTKLFLSVIGLAMSCWTCQQNTDIKKAEWLIGTWANRTPNGDLYEHWTKISDFEFKGKSYSLKGKDTVIYTSMRLAQEQNNLIYIPTVKAQNGGQPVRFPLKTISKTMLLFENPEHDFPQMISYTKIGRDSLVAEISGTYKGKQEKEIFSMTRVK